MTTISTNEIKNLVKENLDFAKKIKNYLHEYPELSSKEFKTRKFLIDECKKLGLEIEEVEKSFNEWFETKLKYEMNAAKQMRKNNLIFIAMIIAIAIWLIITAFL